MENEVKVFSFTYMNIKHRENIFFILLKNQI